MGRPRYTVYGGGQVKTFAALDDASAKDRARQFFAHLNVVDGELWAAGPRLVDRFMGACGWEKDPKCLTGYELDAHNNGRCNCRKS